MKTYIFEGSQQDIGHQHASVICEHFDDALAKLTSTALWQHNKKSMIGNIIDNCRNVLIGYAIVQYAQSLAQFAPYINGLKQHKDMNVVRLFTLVLNEVVGGDRRGILMPFGCSGITTPIDDNNVIGKNFDFQYCLKDFQALIVRKQHNMLSYGAFTPLLMPVGGQFCMNEAGLIVSYNYAYARTGYCKGGLPLSFVVGDLMSHCQTIEHALARLGQCNYKVGNGGTLTICDSKNSTIVELFANDRSQIQTHGYATHTNHFQSESMQKHNIPKDTPFKPLTPNLTNQSSTESSATRLAMAQNAKSQLNSVAALETLLGEHNNVENGLNNMFQIGDYWGTISSCIGLPHEKKVIYYDDIRAKAGKTYHLDELF